MSAHAGISGVVLISTTNSLTQAQSQLTCCGRPQALLRRTLVRLTVKSKRENHPRKYFVYNFSAVSFQTHTLPSKTRKHRGQTPDIRSLIEI